jgi:hypothetical protein
MSDDELDRLLTAPVAPASPALRERLRAETTHRLRLRRYTRRLAVAGTLVACYAAGLATVWWGYRPAAPPLERVTVEVVREQPAPDPAPRSPREIELAAEQADGAESARLFLDAARAFTRSSDWDAALRCYRNALDISGGNLAIDPKNDDWLMVTLKLARKEEQSHANVDN